MDFFFCLSGFVLANGYDQKLRSGLLPNRVFFLKRLVRLYPLIVIGVALGALAALEHRLFLSRTSWCLQ
ncbi:peptidoglycan/LPS O-acetylase OafA/YrhL [Rhizobium sp. BK619]|nr:peptidoglycan/LPS O-acetylase OafA/YrhL [Rhizobium sp. BK619]